MQRLLDDVQKNLDGMVEHYYDQLDFFKRMELTPEKRNKIIAEAEKLRRKRKICRGMAGIAALVGVGAAIGIVYYRILKKRDA